ncbi:prohibitin-3, mitochondrial [Canna indica]|uniref:Prohibitin n=1 Tax=Canna indica TaxID=4628 RepID=A0AAQ3L0A9_9LILI|nr:prohibitin-3, mitochondrial [Canna indica]WOL15746.1 prohibitin-3, mitochondrial [Canna indica]
MTERPHVSALVRRTSDFNIVVDDVAITASPIFLTGSSSKFLFARAEGESQAAKLISEATASAGTGLVELRRIEAGREIASTLSKTSNVAYLPGVQCDNCLKWRKIPSKEEYEAIRENILDDNSTWYCHMKPNVSCDDPSQVEPDDDDGRISAGAQRVLNMRSDFSRVVDVYYVMPNGHRLRI